MTVPLALGAGAAAGIAYGAFNKAFGDKPQAPNNIFEKDPETGFDRSGLYHYKGDITDNAQKLEEGRLSSAARTAEYYGQQAEARSAQHAAQQEQAMQRQRFLQGEYEDFLAGKRQSAAALQSQAMLNDAGRQAMAVAGSARGYGGGTAALRGAQLAQQGMAQEATTQGGILRAQEEAQARKQLGDLYQADFQNRFAQQQLTDQEWQAYNEMTKYWEERGVDHEKARLMAMDLMTQRVLENMGLQTSSANAALAANQREKAAALQFIGTMGVAGLNYKE